MSLAEAVVLGLVQGFTEFLPVSSSGHLVLAQAVLGLRLPGVFFEVVVHVATLCAVLWVYRARVGALARGVLTGEREAVVYVLLLLLASVPAGVAGLMGRDFFHGTYEAPLLAASMLLVTGAFVWSISRTAPLAEDPRPGPAQALGVGVAQALAILPGVSRSGSTVATGAAMGVDVIRMAEFSFLMSVPAIGGAAILELRDAEAVAAQVGGLALALGFLAALLSGVAAIRIFVRMLRTRTFHRFAYYCWAVGLAYLAAAAVFPELRG